MRLIPKELNVVVAGHWNLAILSPAGIAKRLFELAENSPIEVLVPIEGVGQIQVRHNGISVLPAVDRLAFAAAVPSFELLDSAKTLAAKAIESLPETPFQAVGVNLHFNADDSDVPSIMENLQSERDDTVSDAGMVVISRSLTRSIQCKTGVVNLTVSCDSASVAAIQMNFELRSSDPKSLTEWLRSDTSEFFFVAEELESFIIGVEEE